VSDQLHASAALLPAKSSRYPLYRRLGGPQSRSGQYGEVKILDPTGTRTPTSPPTHSSLLYFAILLQSNGYINQEFLITQCFIYLIDFISSKRHVSQPNKTANIIIVPACVPCYLGVQQRKTVPQWNCRKNKAGCLSCGSVWMTFRTVHLINYVHKSSRSVVCMSLLFVGFSTWSMRRQLETVMRMTRISAGEMNWE
jgi:hypothetical protein